MGLVCAADPVESHFFLKPLRLCGLAIDKGIIRVVTDNVMVLNINEWRVAADNGYAKEVVKSELKWSRFEGGVPVRRLRVPKSEMPFADTRGRVSGILHHLAKC